MYISFVGRSRINPVIYRPVDSQLENYGAKVYCPDDLTSARGNQ
jgi:hypothetical protein